MGVRYECDRCKNLITSMITEITIDNYHYNKMSYYFCSECSKKIIECIKNEKTN